MSTELDQARKIAERIAQRVAGESPSTGRSNPSPEVGAQLAAVRAGLGELQKKLDQIEATVTSTPQPNRPASSTPAQRPVLITHSPWLAGINSSYSHPSQERFGVEEATVTELVDFFEKEKVCNVEPGGKPCDHCAMCSSRGF